MKINKTLIILAATATIVTACGHREQESIPCPQALMTYTQKYPASEPTDIYKLVFQDMFGPGHLITDSSSCAQNIASEVAAMTGNGQLPNYEYTLCDSNFVRVNLSLVRDHTLGIAQLTSALLRSAQGIQNPDMKYIVSHSAAFKQAYDPHYRIVRRDIFEKELKPLIEQ